MKKFLLVALLVGIVAISGCVKEAAENEDQAFETGTSANEQAQQQIQQAAQIQYDPLTAAEIDDIKEQIDDLSTTYEIKTFTSTNDLTFISLYTYSTYRESDMTKIFKYMRADSNTKEYEIELTSGMTSAQTSDDITCGYRVGPEKIDELNAVNWYGWQDQMTYNTCSV